MSENNQATLAAPEGWQLVPKELTDDMLVAGFEAQPEAGTVSLTDAYKAMLATAPGAAAPAQAGQQSLAMWFDQWKWAIPLDAREELRAIIAFPAPASPAAQQDQVESLLALFERTGDLNMSENALREALVSIIASPAALPAEAHAAKLNGPPGVRGTPEASAETCNGTVGKDRATNQTEQPR